MKNRNLGTLGHLLAGNRTIEPRTRLNEFRNQYNSFEDSWVRVMEKKSYVAYVSGHKNSSGESAPWVIKDHDGGKILSSHKTESEAKSHLKDMHVHGGSIKMDLSKIVTLDELLKKVAISSNTKETDEVYIDQFIKIAEELSPEEEEELNIASERMYETLQVIQSSFKDKRLKYYEHLGYGQSWHQYPMYYDEYKCKITFQTTLVGDIGSKYLIDSRVKHSLDIAFHDAISVFVDEEFDKFLEQVGLAGERITLEVNNIFDDFSYKVFKNLQVNGTYDEGLKTLTLQVIFSPTLYSEIWKDSDPRDNISDYI